MKLDFEKYIFIIFYIIVIYIIERSKYHYEKDINHTYMYAHTHILSVYPLRVKKIKHVSFLRVKISQIVLSQRLIACLPNDNVLFAIQSFVLSQIALFVVTVGLFREVRLRLLSHRS